MPGGYPKDARVGRCVPGAQTLTLFNTKISILLPCLRLEWSTDKLFMGNYIENNRSMASSFCGDHIYAYHK